MATIVRPAAAPRRVDGAWLAAREAAERARAEGSAEAARLLEEARAEADLLREAARAEGREAGLASATAALAAAVVERDRLLVRSRQELVSLALEIARRIAGEAAARDPEVVVTAAARALAVARGRVQLALRVHPDDVAAVRAAEPRLEAAAARGFAVVPDAGISRGGARVESEAGCVDARIEAQLSALRRALEAP